MVISTNFFPAEMKSLTLSILNISKVISRRLQLVLTIFLKSYYRFVAVFRHSFKWLKFQLKKYSAFLNKQPLPRNIDLARHLSRVVSISMIRSVK
jgi:hypothetical protein